ncbi:MAG: heterodisulfide reductase [Thermocladium sp. ECH_B]|nr:MAG: heterodisulfide reductase [Thermocladium sp. ECH_B]
MNNLQLCYVEYYGLPRVPSMIAVYGLAVLSIILFFYILQVRLRKYGVGLWEFISIILRGYRAWLPFLGDVLSHRRFLRDERLGGTAHLMIFYSLAASLLGTILVAINQYAGILLSTQVYCGSLFLAYSGFVMDVTAWIMVIGSLLGMYRVIQRKGLYTRMEYFSNIGFLAGLIYLAVSGALIESYRFAERGLTQYAAFMPNAYLFSPLHISSLDYMLLYYSHFPIAFLLIAILPATAIFHSVLGLYNYIINYGRPLGELKKPFDLRELLQKENPEMPKVGYSNASEIPKLNKLEALACTDCFRCQDNCPAYAVGRPLSPTLIMTKIKQGLDAGQDKLIDGSVLDDELWACTTCGACMEACPVYIRHVDYIIDMRRDLVMNMRMDQKKSSLILNLSQSSNSLGMNNMGRHDWLRELGVKSIQENPGFEYLFWVGCMGSFDAKAKEIVKSLIEILRTAGVLDKVAVLGDEETCCGDPARRLGEEGRFQEIAMANIDLFNKYGVKKILTICPHGFNTFRNEYPKLGLSGVKVIHHVELIKELMEEGKLKLNVDVGKLTIHDPCYLARNNDVVEPQRIVVSKLGDLIEVERHGKKTFCCGAGGANYWYDVPEKKRISHERFEQLTKTGADTIVTLCPFCNAMLDEASRAKGSSVKVMDISQVIRKSMNGE